MSTDHFWLSNSTLDRALWDGVEIDIQKVIDRRIKFASETDMPANSRWATIMLPSHVVEIMPPELCEVWAKHCPYDIPDMTDPPPQLVLLGARQLGPDFWLTHRAMTHALDYKFLSGAFGVIRLTDLFRILKNTQSIASDVVKAEVMTRPMREWYNH